MIRKITAPLNLKKKKKKKKMAQTKPLRHCNENNFLFQILPTNFQKNQKT